MRSKSVYFQKNGIVGAGLMQIWMRSGATLVLTILLTAVGWVPQFAFGATIAAEAAGSTTPPQAPFPNTVSNGDFTISPTSDCTADSDTCRITGDGINDFTTWTFDFSNTLGVSDFIEDFEKSGKLSSAKLTLQLTPKVTGFSTDDIRIDKTGLTIIELVDAVPNFNDIQIGVLTNIEIQLLNFYTSDEIMGVFLPAKTLPMKYTDDAIISFARLELTTPVSEPATLSILSFGLASLGFYRQRKGKRPSLIYSDSPNKRMQPTRYTRG